MKEKLKKAILNNNDLYEAVFGAQSINFNREQSICYCLGKTPPLYSNLVTVSEGWKPDEIFSSIEENFKNENWEEWSIKDSFAALDLHVYGFKNLFDANWFYLEAEHFAASKNASGINYKIVETAENLSDWLKAWDSDENLGRRIFQNSMLDNPKIRFVAGYDKEKILSGCLINKTEDVLGISNFFAPDSSVEHWSEIIEFVHNSIEFADIVGYERKDLVKKLQMSGFEAVGDLTVWLRNRASDE